MSFALWPVILGQLLKIPLHITICTFVKYHLIFHEIHIMHMKQTLYSQCLSSNLDKIAQTIIVVVLHSNAQVSIMSVYG